MKIGLAKECITPQLPVYLAGFAGVRKAVKVGDDLYVKVVVYEHDKTLFGCLSYDLVAIDDKIINRVKEGIKALGLLEEQFLFAATHTHSGPGGIVETTKGILHPAEDIFVTTDKQQIRNIAEKSILALKKAVLDCQESTISYAHDTLEHIGDNRNRLELKGNQDLSVIFIEQLHGKKAMLINYACHPTILNGTNVHVSADFPGAISSSMEKHGYFMSVYFNGSCGDISTRFSRKGSDANEVLRYGHMFEEKLLKMIPSAKKIEINTFRIMHDHISLKLKQADCIEHAQAEVMTCEKNLLEAKEKGIKGSALRVIESYKEGADANLKLAQHAYTQSAVDVELMLININDHIVVCVPGELFSELSNPLQNEHVHFIGYANGYLGYFADEKAYDNYYYEALSSPFEKGQSEELMDHIKQRICDLLRKPTI